MARKRPRETGVKTGSTKASRRKSLVFEGANYLLDIELCSQAEKRKSAAKLAMVLHQKKCNGMLDENYGTFLRGFQDTLQDKLLVEDSDDADPTYVMFLDNVKENGNAYILDVSEENGVYAPIKYEVDDEPTDERKRKSRSSHPRASAEKRRSVGVRYFPSDRHACIGKGRNFIVDGNRFYSRTTDCIRDATLRRSPRFVESLSNELKKKMGKKHYVKTASSPKFSAKDRSPDVIPFAVPRQTKGRSKKPFESNLRTGRAGRHCEEIPSSPTSSERNDLPDVFYCGAPQGILRRPEMPYKTNLRTHRAEKQHEEIVSSPTSSEQNLCPDAMDCVPPQRTQGRPAKLCKTSLRTDTANKEHEEIVSSPSSLEQNQLPDVIYCGGPPERQDPCMTNLRTETAGKHHEDIASSPTSSGKNRFPDATTQGGSKKSNSKSNSRTDTVDETYKFFLDGLKVTGESVYYEYGDGKRVYYDGSDCEMPLKDVRPLQMVPPTSDTVNACPRPTATPKPCSATAIPSITIKKMVPKSSTSLCSKQQTATPRPSTEPTLSRAQTVATIQKLATSAKSTEKDQSKKLGSSDNKILMKGAQGPQTKFSWFWEDLEERQRKPFDQKEYEDLWQLINFKKPISIYKDSRTGGHYMEGAMGTSYLEKYPDLECEIKKVEADRLKVLNHLRGFFFYLLKVPFNVPRPWKGRQD